MKMTSETAIQRRTRAAAVDSVLPSIGSLLRTCARYWLHDPKGRQNIRKYEKGRLRMSYISWNDDGREAPASLDIWFAGQKVLEIRWEGEKRRIQKFEPGVWTSYL